jgi:hypothetical protein
MAERRFAGGPVPSFDYTDLVTADYTLNLALVYNWLYEKFSSDERGRIRKALVEKGIRPVLNDHANGIWWAEQWHSRGVALMSAVGVGGLSLFDDEPDAAGWVSESKKWVGGYLQRQGRDGGCHDGFAGWTEGFGPALVFMEALRSRLGDRDLYRNRYIGTALDFGLYGVMPDKVGVANFGTASYGTAAGTTWINWRLAAHRKDAVAQWNAMEMWRANRESSVFKAKRAVWDFLWYEAGMPMQEPQGYAAAKHFRDIGWTVMRTGWREKYVMLALRGAAPTGLFRAGDAGNMVFGAYGEPVLVTQPPSGPGDVAEGAYNCVYIDGMGPRPGVWDAPDSTAPQTGSILEFRHERGYDYVLTDATAAYGGRATRVHRHVIFVKPDYIVVIDDVDAEQPVRLEQRWHTVDDVEIETGYAELASGDVRLRVESPMAGDLVLNPAEGKGAVPHAVLQSPDPSRMHTLVTVLSPGFKRTRSYHPKIETTDDGFSIKLMRNSWRDTITCTKGADRLDVSVAFKPALKIPERNSQQQGERPVRPTIRLDPETFKK